MGAYGMGVQNVINEKQSIQLTDSLWQNCMNEPWTRDKYWQSKGLDASVNGSVNLRKK